MLYMLYVYTPRNNAICDQVGCLITYLDLNEVEARAADTLAVYQRQRVQHGPAFTY